MFTSTYTHLCNKAYCDQMHRQMASLFTAHLMNQLLARDIYIHSYHFTHAVYLLQKYRKCTSGDRG